MSTPTTKNKVELAQRLGAIMAEPGQEARPEPKKLNQDLVNEAYKKFLAKEIPDLSHYEIRGEQIIVEVFAFYEESKLLLNHSGLTAGDVYGRHTFAVAKVLHASNSSSYKKGDIIKLKDSEAATIPNPRYEMWTNNPYSKSNVERVGETPPPLLNNLWNAHGLKIFKINPLKQDMTKEDWLIFKLADVNVECLISNPNALV